MTFLLTTKTRKPNTACIQTQTTSRETWPS